MLFQNWLSALRSKNTVRGYWQARGRRLLRASTGQGPTLISSAALSATPAGVETLERRALLTTIAIPSVTNGNISLAGEVDTYQFTAVAGTTYAFTTVLNSTTDPVLQLLAADGTTVLAFDDDSGPLAASVLLWTAPVSGTNFIAVRGFGSSTPTYALSATTVESVALPANLSRSLSPTNDVDYFSFPAVSGGTYLFEVGSDFDLQLYRQVAPSSSTATTFLATSSGTASSRILFTATATETLVLSVAAKTGNFATSYSLDASPVTAFAGTAGTDAFEIRYLDDTTREVYRNAALLETVTGTGDIAINAGTDTTDTLVVTGLESAEFFQVHGASDSATIERATGPGTNNRALGPFQSITVNGAGGDDSLKSFANRTITLAGGNDNDTLTGSDNADDVLQGGGDNDVLAGGIGNDTLDGGAGNDTLNGGYRTAPLVGIGIATDGNDTLIGGPGDDTYGFNDGFVNVDVFGNVILDEILSLGTDQIIDEDAVGIDRINLSGLVVGGNATLNLGLSSVQVVTPRLSLQQSAGTLLENVTGTFYADTLTGNALANTLDGGSDADTLDGGEGSDSLFGGGGNDILIGGDGALGNDLLDGGLDNDRYVFDNDLFLGRDTITDAGGIDTFDASPTSSDWALTINLGLTTEQEPVAENFFTLTSATAIENVIGGQANDVITGNSLNNEFDGQGGDDRFVFDTDTPLGSDKISRDAGVDTLDFSGSTAGVNVNLSASGSQTVNSNLTLNMFSGTPENIIGGSGNDVLAGNVADNTLTGGPGDDRYVFGDASSISETDTVVEQPGEGTDTLDFSAALSSMTVNLTNEPIIATNSNRNVIVGAAGQGANFENIIGGSAGDSLTGNAANNVLTGGGGDDTLSGGGGNDRYLFNTNTPLGSDSISEASGTDTIDFTGSTLGATLDIGLLGSVQTVNTNLQLQLSDPAPQIENLVGGSGDDTFAGNSLNNNLQGGNGSDTYVFVANSSLGTDTISEVGGVDTVSFAGTTTPVALNLGLNTPQPVNANLSLLLQNSVPQLENLIGGSAGDTLTGNSQNNVLTGGAGSDTLVGGSGSDRYVFNADSPLGSDTVNDASGNDTLDYSASTLGVNVNLAVGASQTVNVNQILTLTSGSSIEQVLGGSGNDVLTGNSLNNTLAGGSGADRYVFNTSTPQGNDTVTDIAGVDTLDFTGSTLGVTLNLGLSTPQTVNNNQTLTLTDAFIENVTGGSGNDTLSGNGQNNTLSGGSGNDTYLFVTNLNLGSDTILDSAGVDTISFAGTFLNVAIDLQDFTLQTVNNNLKLALDSNGFQFENLIGGDGNDQLLGNPLNNTFIGGPGNDTLSGSSGDDTFVFDTDSQLGTDIVAEAPGSGSDTLDFSTSSNAVAVNLAVSGNQIVNSNLTFNLLSTTLENIIGGAGNDTLTGTAADNVLTGGGGSDTLNGGVGSDRYVFNTGTPLGSDTITDTEVSPFDLDTVDFTGSTNGVALNLGLTSAQAVNGNLTLTLAAGSRIENLTGGSGNDTLTGNSLNNLLTGGGGNDRYVFNTSTPQGSDTVSDSAGVDTLDFTGSTAGVTVNLGTQQVQTVNSNQTLTLVSSIAIENLTGGSGDDRLTGNTLNNTLSGSTGNDTYVFLANSAQGSDTVLESGGVDTVTFAGTNAAVALNLGLITPQTVNPNLTLTLGNSTPQLENLTGGNGSDTLTGNGQNNVLIGGAGDDTLNGGTGSDTYAFDTDSQLGSDTVTDPAGGSDTLDFSASTNGVTVHLSINTPQNVSTNLLLTLADASPTIENVIGGAGNDTITGSLIANVITGGPGNDTLAGASSNDRYVFDIDSPQGSDTINDGSGIDTIDFSGSAAAVTFNLGLTTNQVLNSNLSLRLTDATSTIENLIGGSGNDTLTGNGLNNTLTGGAGNDRYVLNTSTALGVDTITDSAGTDTIDFTGSTTGVTLNLGITTNQTVQQFLQLTLTDAAAIENVIGGNGDDTFTGNSLNNTLTGGNGNDTYVFVANSAQGSDTILESGGVDTVTFAGTTSAVAFDLSLNTPQPVNSNLTLTLGNSTPQLENLTGGSGNDTLTGNAQNNTLTGGAGSDTLAGSTGSDTYVFADATAAETDTVIELANAGGSDRLDFSAMTTGVTANLTLDATLDTMTNRAVQTGATGQAANFEQVIGGSGNDILTGNAANNLLVGNAGTDTLSGGTGRDLLVGGAGADTLSGGTNSDILIGGLTSLNSDALSTILGRWGLSGTYASRVTSVTTGTPKLTSFELTNDSANDTLDGGAGTGDVDLDLFFTSTGDTLSPAAEPGEQIISI